MQYAPTACRIKYTAIYPNHDHRQSLIYTEKPRLQTYFLIQNKISYTLKISTYNSLKKNYYDFFREKFVAIQNSYTLAAA